MIRYTLKCSQDHVFESWFADAEGFGRLRAAGHVACAICGDTDVQKTLMAPAVAPKGDAAAPGPDLSRAASPRERALRKFREHVEANSEHVGKDFAKEARAMHDGQAPDRAIHGEASFAEARNLIEDGIPVAPLPFLSPKRTN